MEKQTFRSLSDADILFGEPSSAGEDDRNALNGWNRRITCWGPHRIRHTHRQNPAPRDSWYCSGGASATSGKPSEAATTPHGGFLRISRPRDRVRSR
ncbi:hypothetical protein ZHAS_00019024 [Anopheles sinensis]|uniref:Uncharacterized protein n=1 Tax=Anopheles sinensis TaxID=74873 RepID=A0A084WL86_ANOSI|nr:hypothetical protein ZHAS_00019024 [Anopheles sinensis]